MGKAKTKRSHTGITEQADPTRIYQNYDTGVASPVIEYTAWDRGEPIGPFLTWGAANFVLTARQTVRESQAERSSYRAALAA